MYGREGGRAGEVYMMESEWKGTNYIFYLIAAIMMLLSGSGDVVICRLSL